MFRNRVYENQNLLSLQLASFLVGLRTYQHPCTYQCLEEFGASVFKVIHVLDYLDDTSSQLHPIYWFVSVYLRE